MVDTQGFVLKAFVTEADYQDRVVAQWLLKGLKEDYPRLAKIWADGAYYATPLGTLTQSYMTFQTAAKTENY